MSTTPPITVYINFIAEINDKTTNLLLFVLTDQLRNGVSSYRLNISSGGGSVFHAISIHNFLIGLKDVTIHTHNLGQIDSAANLVFLAGHTRTASKASTFLLHPPQMNIHNPMSFTMDLMRERLDSLEKDQDKMASIISSKIQKSKDEILKMFQDRNTLPSEEAKQLGFISAIEEFVASPGVPIYSITNQS